MVYDNIQFTKSGWIHRNRILVNGSPKWITLALKKDSDTLDIRERNLQNPAVNNNKLLRRIEGAYKKAPYFNNTYSLLKKCLTYDDNNLFKFIFNTIVAVCQHLSINTKIIISSTIPIDHSLKKQDRVIALCKFFNADEYINPPGGKLLYDKTVFNENGIELYFLEPEKVIYDQGIPEFVPQLSIIDVMMFNSLEKIKEYLNMYRLT